MTMTVTDRQGTVRFSGTVPLLFTEPAFAALDIAFPDQAIRQNLVQYRERCTKAAVCAPSRRRVMIFCTGAMMLGYAGLHALANTAGRGLRL